MPSIIGAEMLLKWEIEDSDVTTVKDIIQQQSCARIVLDRIKNNLADNKRCVTKRRLWKEIVSSRLTTLARVSKDGNLARFLNTHEHRLSYNCIEKISSDRLESYVLETLHSHSIGTHRRKISSDLAKNFITLEAKGWDEVLFQCNQLIRLQPRATEAKVANYINDRLVGFGPKQSRNMLQGIGLTRYEKPIDSRVTNWLNKRLRLPLKVTPTALSDKHCYALILDAVCCLCEKCGIYPCILDASIFGGD